MVFLALPNAFRLPNNNPSATAELAPVPGAPQQNAPQSNFAETGFAESGGLGSGDDGGGFELPPLPPGEEVPTDKECVGDPPRQTEDPLSPPCVPFFSGQNGGATYKGVTPNEIRVMFYNGLGVEGDLSQPYKPSDETGNQGDFQQTNLVKTIKAQLRYFQRRFQTYGRTVRLIGQDSQGSTPQAQRGDAIIAGARYDPFSAVFLGDNAQDYFSQLARDGRTSYGLNFDVPRSYYDENRPFVWSFVSDQETETAWSASAICRMLLGRDGPSDTRLPARFTTDPSLANQPRKIGFIWGRESQRGPSTEQMAVLLKNGVKSECGYTFDKEWTFTGAAGAGAKEAPRIMAEAKTEGITTLVCYCVPVPTEQTVSTMMGAASSANYHPEWYWDHASAMDRPIWHQTFGATGDKQHESIGVTYFWRQPAFRQQSHYRAYVEETKDGSVPNVRFNFSIYYLFLNLFTAIQAAGPELTPESAERGMFTFRYVNPNDPDLPTGSYGLDGPGTYTFIDTAMGWYWDPTGTPPGGKTGEGCMRLMHEGRRYAADGAPKVAPRWPIGDDGLAGAKAGGPCTEDTRKLQDPQPGDFQG